MAISETTNTIIIISLILAFLVSAAPFDPDAFQTCVTSQSEPLAPPATAFYSPYKNKTSFDEVLNATAHDLRFLVPSLAKPLLLFTPLSESHAKAALTCARFQNINFRVRSGGHDYEGLSYVSYTRKPFIVVDMSRLRNITVDTTARTAWAQAGASIGELYYRISQESSTLGFPAGLCTTLGLGGMLSGGAYGVMMRKYGLGDDNVIDARILTACGVIKDRQAMGEDLFWAIRGGSGGSFGIVLAWKVALVPVPEIVTVFTVAVFLEHKGTKIMQKWQQVAPTIDEDLFIRVLVEGSVYPGTEANKTVLSIYQGVYLGNQENLMNVMNEGFPELGLTEKSCSEGSWIESVMYIAGFPKEFKPEYLLKVIPAFINSFKAKSDYLTEEIPKEGLEGMWEILKEDTHSLVIFNPSGGRMSQINEHALPFPHRDALAMIQYAAQWNLPIEQQKSEAWVRRLYEHMTPYVTSQPREAYANYRDFDIGLDPSRRGWNCSLPALWGPKYFKNNFKRLVEVKTMVDPLNVFNHELSIPTWKSINTCTRLF